MVALSVVFTLTWKDTVTVWPAGTATVHCKVPVLELTVQVAVVGRVVGHLADVATKVVPAGAVSFTTSVPLAVPALWTLRL